MTTSSLAWESRAEPLAADAVLGSGAAARLLAVAAADRLRGGAALRACLNEHTLLVLGETVDLPWAPGVTYLGRDGGALVPTTRRTVLPADLLRQALVQRVGRDLLVVLHEGGLLTTIRPEATADPVHLEFWAGRP